ncbi:MAG: exodeoxyribonuclease VII large subunit [Candidatus Methanomethylophilaceae archaeon]|nr:exodeoxyribonuclease VII large subunit [Candidatus Methanomethylophilaceae archaeon]
MDAPLSVSQFNRMVKQLVECERLSDIVVVGELKEYKPSSGGHVYPVLTDGSSVIPCTLFKSVVSRLNFQPKVGMKVEVFGSASYYEPYGKLSFNIRGMKPAGEGDEKKKLEELKLKLIEEGLFERKRPLPRYPRTIGVVTSQTGAVIKDIVDTARRRFPANILLAPAKVQGDGAAESIVAGIEMLNREGVDIIIVGRGGGSADDLKAFNEEIVARAMFASKAPTISAVGHATDKSITDLVADRYAETPTAAATIALPDLNAEVDRVNTLTERLDGSLLYGLDVRKKDLRLLTARVDARSPINVLRLQKGTVHGLSQRMDSRMDRYLQGCRHTMEMIGSKFDLSRLMTYMDTSSAKVDDLSESMDSAMGKYFELRNERLDAMSSRLTSLDPNRVLDRGYSYITDSEGRTVTSVGSLTDGSSVNIRMRDGRAVAEIKEVVRNG